MQFGNLLFFTLTLLVAVVFFAGSANSASDCSDNNYALTHPVECSCASNNYALTHPYECGSPVAGCENNDYALTHPLECSRQPVGCNDNNYALTHPLECAKPAIGCDGNNYALTHPLECGKKVGCENNDYALTHPLECARCEAEFTNSYRCSGNERQRLKQLSDCSTVYEKVETCTYSCNPSTAACISAPVCTPGSRRWGSLPETLSPSLCQYGWTAIADCNQYGQWVFVDCVSPYEDTCTPSTSCSVLGCGKTDSCGTFCGSCPAPADNLPTATISVPASAAPGSNLNIAVTGNDDNDVAQLLLYDASSNLLAGFTCTGVQTSCSHTFTATAPNTPSTAYTFKARSKDSASQLSGFVSGSGTTTAAPVVPPVVPPPVTPPPVTPPDVEVTEMPKPLQVIAVKFPLQPLFMRALNFPDSDCVRPGESALLAVKVQNTAKAALKDLKFTAAVPELGVRVSGGPAKLKANGKLTQLLRLDIPYDAEKGEYYLRFSISNNKFSRTVHRTFVVDGSC